MEGKYHHSQLLVEMEPGRPQKSTFPISASQVTWITGMSQQCLAHLVVLIYKPAT
jgi:hypothetical protein